MNTVETNEVETTHTDAQDTVEVGQVNEFSQEENATSAPMSEREFKIAYARALKERKEKIKQNKEMIADLELEVAYRKAQSDLLKYRFEHMDYYLKNLEIEPRYLVAKDEQLARQNQATVENQKAILD